MPDTSKLEALRSRLIAQQRELLMQAADAGTLPPAGALEQIADFENTIAAIDALIEESATEEG